MSQHHQPTTGFMLTQMPSEPDTLTIVAEFPHANPDQLFAFWTQPGLLTQWWPEQAEIDAREGGAYRLSWPRMNWHLRGRFLVYKPNRELAFTWKWDHEPEAEAETVRILFEPQPGGGTAIALTHSPYDESEESQENRMNHLEGWKHFLGKLQTLQAEQAPQ